ncbi:hypothetical protein CsSME_00054222 [Camellia sinensis var. sinensis]
MITLVGTFDVYYEADGFWRKVETMDLVLYFDGADVYIGEWDVGGLLPDVLRFAAGGSIVSFVVHSCHGGAKSIVVSSEQLRNLRCVLLCFEAVLGLKVNLAKLELIPVGEVVQLSTLAAILGCKVSHLSVSYLGLPLGAPYNVKGVWDGVLERVQHQLVGWKRQ